MLYNRAQDAVGYFTYVIKTNKKERESLYAVYVIRMPSILVQHGLGKGIRTTRFYGTSDANPDLVVRIPKALANEAAITRDRISVLAKSDGVPLLVRPRDCITLYVNDVSITMSVLGVYPLADLCQRRGVIDRAVLILVVM
jgi:hypothetical protein